MQQNLFAEADKPKATGLIITNNNKKPLSKSQLSFNRLIAKIEKLQRDIEQKQLQFDAALKMYGDEYVSILNLKLKVLQKQIELLWEVYQGKKLSKANQRKLKEILQFFINEYFSQSLTEPDKILQDIFSNLEGISYDKMMKEEKNKNIDEVKKMFEDMDVDTEGVDLEDPNALATKIAEAQQKAAEKQEQHFKMREERKKKKAGQQKNNTKQQEYQKLQEAAAEAKKKNISSIYRQLAKLFHPDLEQNAALKAEKEMLMKELTVAFENRDLHTLLTLELKWIHKENDHLADIADEKINVYLQILKEQAAELEQEKYAIIYRPQYAVLLNQFGFEIAKNPVREIRDVIISHTEMAESYDYNVRLLASENGLRHVKQMIKEWKHSQYEMSDEEIFEIMMKKFI